ncbi:11331_t:CDS:2 [Ambispora leptoticha]|uniref:11331_t:CDS:1 n=1 Tax=Ambispora leptoticha TaxID=144679 RepID=A0A9N9AEL1_9GLOM|nr:11331_t:CDS:2 [Ambispora leptoticha]
MSVNPSNKILVQDIPSDAILEFKRSLSKEARVLSATTTDEVEAREYKEASVWWADNSAKPAGVIVQVAELDDIAKTINFVRIHNLDFAVRAGRHSTSGASSTNGGLLLDLKKLNKVRVDPENKLVYAQGGALGKDIDNEASQHGLACVCGVVDDTGIGGLTLGGGFGYLTGRYGLMIDNLVSATIVIADGSVKHVSSTSNPDLYWGIRGGCSNLGVVYEFVYKAHDQKNKVYAGLLGFEAEKLQSVVEACNEWFRKRTEDESVMLIIGRLPPEFKPVIICVIFNNSDSEELYLQRFEPFLRLPAFMNQVSLMPYQTVNTLCNNFTPYGGRKAFKSVLLSQFSYPVISNAYKSYVSFTDAYPDAQETIIALECHDGRKMATVKREDTAFGFRHNFFNLNIGQKWYKPENDLRVNEWATSIAKEFEKSRDVAGSYANFNSVFDELQDGTIDDREKRAKKVFGENLQRMKELKKKYDPNVLFDKWVVIVYTFSSSRISSRATTFYPAGATVVVLIAIALATSFEKSKLLQYEEIHLPGNDYTYSGEF